jgi:hypothetical protein
MRHDFDRQDAALGQFIDRQMARICPDVSLLQRMSAATRRRGV